MAYRSIVVALASLLIGPAASAQEPVAPPSRATAVNAPERLAPDCDGNGTLDALDFLCFQGLFAAGDPDADCDGSGVLDLFDLVCFHNAFAAGFPLAVIEPDWMARPAPGQWCVANEQYIAGMLDRGINPLAVVCAEDGPCDNPGDRDASIPTLDTPIKTYRLSIHVFCDNNGGNCAATQADVAAAVERLNNDYAPWRIQFIHEWRFVKSTKYRTLDSWEAPAMKNAYAVSPGSRLNVYVVKTGGGNWGTFPWDPAALTAQGGVVMDETVFRADSWFPSVLTHEVGHCLGLWHTHHGVTEVPECGDCYEAAGRSPEQGDITGDRCSDTNPTPRNDGKCFDAPGTDPCSGEPWGSTPYLNYMGYAYFTCPIEFTPQQAGRMHCWTNDVLSGWLEQPAPPAAPGSPTLAKLGGGQVRVSWADNSANEDGFRVQREIKSGSAWINAQIVATVDANTSSAIDTPGAGTFRYRVQAFNGVGDSAWSGWTQMKN